jgi:HD-like signal output (HDOD) protein
MHRVESWLKRMWGPRAPAPGAAAPAADHEAVADAAAAQPEQRDAPGAADPPDADLDRRFTAFLLGAGQLRAGRAEAAERRAIQHIGQLVQEGRASTLVPRLPVELPRLISLVRRDDVSPRELTERLARDPTLVGEVVRLANSPRYRTGRDIADLQGAVIALGQRGLVQLVVSAAMRPIYDARQGRFSRVAGTRLWNVAERCSHACSYLCSDAANRFHGYLAGMVANIGLIGALRVLDADYTEPQPPSTGDFHDALGRAAAALSEQVARQWEFPAAVCQAVRRRTAQPEGADDEGLAGTLRAADRASKRHVLAPGLAGDALAGLDEQQRRGYLELQRAFGG